MMTERIPDDEFVRVRRQLHELSGGDAETLGELIGLLVESLSRSRDGLASAVAAGAQRKLVDQAHALRGAAMMAELTTLGSLAGHIEHGKVAPAALPQAVAHLVALVDQAIAAVHAMGVARP